MGEVYIMPMRFPTNDNKNDPEWFDQEASDLEKRAKLLRDEAARLRKDAQGRKRDP